jgi:4-amino-4-deoxy-L-arabinose transferase-like glycosyltransferase
MDSVRTWTCLLTVLVDCVWSNPSVTQKKIVPAAPISPAAPLLKIALLSWFGLLIGIVLLWQAGSIGLIDETEPLFVEAARQMALSGDWVTPMFNLEPRFDKPPLIYWLMVLGFRLFGINEWGARSPSILMAIALAGFVFYTVYQSQKQSAHSSKSMQKHALRPAILAATLLLVNPNTFFWGRTGYSDMLLNACMGGAMLAFFQGYRSANRPQQWRWYLAFYGCVVLAVLTKGPIGMVLPGLGIGLFTLYLGNFRTVLRELRPLVGLGIILVLSLPWYIAVTLANGDAFINSFFGYHNAERFTRVVNAHAGPWYFHLAVILVGALPWSGYLPAAIAHLQPLRRQYWQHEPRSQQLGLFALFWFASILGFFTIATTKYFSYTLPLMPAAAILVALLWSDYITQPPLRLGWGLRLSGGASSLLFGGLAIVLWLCPTWLTQDPWMPHLGDRLQAAGLPMVGTVIWAGMAIVLLVMVWQRDKRFWMGAIGGFLAFLLFVMHPALLITDTERQLPLRQLAQTVLQVERPGEPLLMVGFKKPSLVFYARQSVDYLTPEFIAAHLQALGTTGKPSALLVAAAKPLRQSQLPSNQYQELGQFGVYKLLRVSTIKDVCRGRAMPCPANQSQNQPFIP